MAVVPAPADFAGGILPTTTENANIRDPLLFLEDRPACQVRQTTLQALTTATFTAVTFTTEDYDGGFGSVVHHDNATNNTRITAQYSGWYLISGGVGFAANATGQRLARWSVNGTQVNAGDLLINTAAANVVQAPARTMLVSLNVGDYVELLAWQNSGGSLNTAVGTGEQSHISFTWWRRL